MPSAHPGACSEFPNLVSSSRIISLTPGLSGFIEPPDTRQHDRMRAGRDHCLSRVSGTVAAPQPIRRGQIQLTRDRNATQTQTVRTGTGFEHIRDILARLRG